MGQPHSRQCATSIASARQQQGEIQNSPYVVVERGYFAEPVEGEGFVFSDEPGAFLGMDPVLRLDGTSWRACFPGITGRECDATRLRLYRGLFRQDRYRGEPAWTVMALKALGEPPVPDGRSTLAGFRWRIKLILVDGEARVLEEENILTLEQGMARFGVCNSLELPLVEYPNHRLEALGPGTSTLTGCQRELMALDDALHGALRNTVRYQRYAECVVLLDEERRPLLGMVRATEANQGAANGGEEQGSNGPADCGGMSLAERFTTLLHRGQGE